jgi:hypothetical protein
VHLRQIIPGDSGHYGSQLNDPEPWLVSVLLSHRVGFKLSEEGRAVFQAAAAVMLRLYSLG